MNSEDVTQETREKIANGEVGTTTLEGLADAVTDLQLRMQHVETYLENPDGPEKVDVTEPTPGWTSGGRDE
jgi:hypothetical protein